MVAAAHTVFFSSPVLKDLWHEADLGMVLASGGVYLLVRGGHRSDHENNGLSCERKCVVWDSVCAVCARFGDAGVCF